MEQTKDIWSNIKDYEGFYQVSTHGQIKSFYKKKPLILKLKTQEMDTPRFLLVKTKLKNLKQFID